MLHTVAKVAPLEVVPLCAPTQSDLGTVPLSCPHLHQPITCSPPAQTFSFQSGARTRWASRCRGRVFLRSALCLCSLVERPAPASSGQDVLGAWVTGNLKNTFCVSGHSGWRWGTGKGGGAGGWASSRPSPCPVQVQSRHRVAANLSQPLSWKIRMFFDNCNLLLLF